MEKHTLEAESEGNLNFKILKELFLNVNILHKIVYKKKELHKGSHWEEKIIFKIYSS